MSNTIIGRVKSFKDYWIHLKGYYWSIQLEIAVWIYWIHLKGLYWRIHLEIAVWILDKRKACWIWDLHSFILFRSIRHLVILCHLLTSTPRLFTFIRSLAQTVTSFNSTQRLLIHSFNMKILICCIGA